MHLFLTYTIFGLVLGGVYGIAASGLVLTYNTSGIFNFAHGAEAMLGAFVYWELRARMHWPAPLVLLLVLGVFGPLMGGVLYAVIMRGLRETAEVTKIVVTVSLMLGMLYLSQWVWNPKAPRNVDLFFGSRSHFKILGSTVTTHELIALGTAVAIAVGLRLFFYQTRTGVAMRGAVDDPDLLELNGHTPERLAALSWAMGSFLAVLAGVLVTPVSGGALEATALTLLVIQAFAAAVFGRLRSVPRTFVGALILGLAANYVLAYFPKSWAWASDFRISLPMIILFLVLVVLPQDRLRGVAMRTRERSHVPSVRTAVIAGAALVGSVVLVRQLMVDSDITTLTVGMTFAIIALSLTLLTGYAGEMNLAAVSFGAIGTLIVFHLGVSGHGQAARTTLWGVVLGVIVTAIVGGLVALPALRLRGLYLALATMAFGVFLTDMVLLDVNPHRLPIIHTRFSLFTQGSLLMPALKVGPLDLANGTTFLVSVTVVFAAIGVGLIAIRNSSYGRRLTAMKDSPAACATLGQSLVKLKLSVFMLSAAVAGLGGILMSTALGSVTSENFAIFISLAVLMLTVVFGVTYVSGALVGGILSGVGFGLAVATLNHLADHHADLHGLYAMLGHVAAVAPALIGIGLARSPSGVVHDIVGNWRPMRDAKPVLAASLAVAGGLYLLALNGSITNWWFVILIFVLVATTPLIGMMAMPYAFLGPDETVRRQADVPDELVGVDAPFTIQVRDGLDQALGIEVTNPLRRVSGPRSGSDEPILELVDLHAGYGPIEVLRGVNLQVPPGAVVALLGPNGGGKTTTLRVCSGLLPATSGQLRVAGRTVNQASASQLARVGVCTIPEGRSIFPNLTVRENLWLATGSGTAFPAVEETAYTRFPVLGQRRQQLAGTLSGGEQQMLALARALGTAPTVLLLDELSLGLAPLIVSQVYDTVRELAAAGISILIAEQFARAVLPIAHSAAIMLHGCIVHVGSPDTIEEQLSTTYLGVNNVA
jgi:ABC-type branched-subunit amino acid transport system ATPase component/branched-subunit amino acid ABC-type transport system permease component